MKIFVFVIIFTLSSCSVIHKDSAELKKIGHDLIDEEIDSSFLEKSKGANV